MIRMIKVLLNDEDNNEINLSAAQSLAMRYGAKIEAIYVRESSPLRELGLPMPELGAQIQEQVTLDSAAIYEDESRLEEIRQLVCLFKDKHHLNMHLMIREGDHSSVIRNEASFTDLLVIGEKYLRKHWTSDLFQPLINTVKATPSPVLVIPENARLNKIGRSTAVVLEKGQSSSDAIHLAMDFFEGSDSVSVLDFTDSDESNMEAHLSVSRYFATHDINDVSFYTPEDSEDFLRNEGAHDMVVMSVGNRSQIQELLSINNVKSMVEQQAAPVLLV